MRLAAIRKLCVKTRTIILFDGPDATQWICNGYAAWPVDGVRLDGDGLPALFDLTEKQRRDFIINHADQFDERWSLTRVPGEEPLTELGTIWWADALYTALLSDAGVMLVPAEWFRPARPKDGDLEYYARWKDGRPLVAAYGDLLCAGLAIPVSDQDADAILAAARAITRPTPFRWPKDVPEELAEQIGLEEVEANET